MGGGISPIDDLRTSLEMAAANQPDDETRARNRATTTKDALSVTPVIGNAMSAESAVQNYRDMVGADSWKEAAKSGLFGAIDTVGAATGLPFGKMAGKAAKGGSSRLNTFVPVEEGKLSEKARTMREGGARNEDVYGTTGMFFGPDGTLRRRIPDNKMDIDWSANPGDVTTVGALVNHPTLFREMPELQNRIVRVTDKVEQKPGQLPRGISRTDPVTGDFEFSKMSGDPYADMAKMLQYDINDRVGFSSAGRHNFSDNLATINSAQLEALRSGAPADARVAYARRMDKFKDTLHDGIKNRMRFKDMDRRIGDVTAGSTDAKIVRGEASLLGDIAGYPYAQDAPWIKGHWQMPAFDEMLVLPPKGATPEDWAQFVENWYRYGSGKGK